jgi:hypothetical protein
MKKLDVSVRLAAVPQRLATLDTTEVRLAWIVFHALGGSTVRLCRFVHALATATPLAAVGSPGAMPSPVGAESTATKIRSLFDGTAIADAGSEQEADADRRLAQHVHAALGGETPRLAHLVDEVARLQAR